MTFSSIVGLGMIDVYANTQRDGWYDIATNVEFASNHVFLDTAPDSFYVRGMPNVTDIRHISEATFTVQAGTSIVIYLNRIDYGIEQAIHFAISNALQGDETHLVRRTATGFTYVRVNEWNIDGRLLTFTFAAPGEYRFWRPGGWTRNFVVVEATGTQTPAPSAPTPQATPAPTATPLPQGTGNIRVTVDGSLVIFADVQPQMVGSRVLVPVRGVFEYMGFDVDWIPATRTATLDRLGISIVIPANNRTFTVNGEVIAPDVSQQIINGRMMLPLRAVAEAVGGTANWVGASRTAVITTQGQGAVATPSPTPSADAHDDERQNELEKHLSRIVPIGRPTILPHQGMPSTSQIADWNNSFNPTEFETAVFNAVNQVRTEHGRIALPWSHTLAAGAALRATYLAESDFSDFGGGTVHQYGSFTTADIHRAIPTRGGWWAVTFNNRAAGVVNNVNITAYDLAQSIVDGWMDSQVHRDRLLSRHNYEVGIGTAINPHTGAIFVYAFFDASGR